MFPSAFGDSFQADLVARSVPVDQLPEHCHFFLAKHECPGGLLSIRCQWMKIPQGIKTCLKRSNKSANTSVVLFYLGNPLIFSEKELQEYT
jgi:hypothetical protein